MGCPSVRRDNPRALASGLSYVQVDKHGITILCHLHQCIPCTSSAFHAKAGKGGINDYSLFFNLSFQVNTTRYCIHRFTPRKIHTVKNWYQFFYSLYE